jgi:MFS transporter, ACS family, glucarate transporter
MKKRHVVLSFLGVLSVITYLDRICIGVAGPRIQDELQLTPEQWSWVLNAFLISYGLFKFPLAPWGIGWGTGAC